MRSARFARFARFARCSRVFCGLMFSFHSVVFCASPLVLHLLMLLGMSSQPVALSSLHRLHPYGACRLV